VGSALFNQSHPCSPVDSDASPTHDLPDTGMGAVRSLVDALVLRHLVGGVDETVCDVVSVGSWNRTIDVVPLACDGAHG
jgi:hypothetical protein